MRKALDSGEIEAIQEIGPASDLVGQILLSPDGTQVFSPTVDSKDPHEWGVIIPTAGGTTKSVKMPVSSGEVRVIKWSPDGKSFLYSKTENGVANIWSAPIDGKTPPKKITNFQSDRIFAFDVSADNRLVISRGAWVSDGVLIKNAR